jgi:hypothetical protein
LPELFSTNTGTSANWQMLSRHSKNHPTDKYHASSPALSAKLRYRSSKVQFAAYRSRDESLILTNQGCAAMGLRFPD